MHWFQVVESPLQSGLNSKERHFSYFWKAKRKASSRMVLHVLMVDPQIAATLGAAAFSVELPIHLEAEAYQLQVEFQNHWPGRWGFELDLDDSGLALRGGHGVGFPQIPWAAQVASCKRLWDGWKAPRMAREVEGSSPQCLILIMLGSYTIFNNLQKGRLSFKYLKERVFTFKKPPLLH